MNTQRTTTRRSEEEMSTVVAEDNEMPPQDNQVPPFEEVATGDQVPVVPSTMTNGEIMTTIITLTQAMPFKLMPSLLKCKP